MRFLAPPHQWFLKLALLKIELWVWPVVASRRCATHVEGLTAGLARAMTPHPRDGPLGGGESARRSTAAKGGDGATAGNAPRHCCAEGRRPSATTRVAGEGGGRLRAARGGWLVRQQRHLTTNSVKSKNKTKSQPKPRRVLEKKGDCHLNPPTPPPFGSAFF
jgi:hypothetical protein